MQRFFEWVNNPTHDQFYQFGVSFAGIIFLMAAVLTFMPEIRASTPIGEVAGIQTQVNCMGDFNHDGFVDKNDLLIFSKNKGKSNIDCQLDLVGNNCLLDIDDFQVFITSYQNYYCNPK